MAGEALSFIAAETILSKLASTVTEEISLASSLTDDIKNLKDKSKIILALLRDAEKGRVQEESVVHWLNNMKDTVYDADDVLNMFTYEMLRRKLEIQTSMKNKVCNIFSLCNSINFRFKMGHRVKDINMVLDRVVKEGTDLGLNQALYRAAESSAGILTDDQREFRQTHPFVSDSKVLGREADKSKVLHMLLQSESEENLSVVAIMGLAGLGKTTLAQLIYNDEGVTQYFKERIWVCVSNDFNVTRILKEMVDDLDISIAETSNKAILIRKLNERLSRKKYLLVLDDVRNTEAGKWEFLTDSLFGIGGDKESKILVTTRSNEVVSTMQRMTVGHYSGKKHLQAEGQKKLHMWWMLEKG